MQEKESSSWVVAGVTARDPPSDATLGEEREEMTLLEYNQGSQSGRMYILFDVYIHDSDMVT